MLLLILLFAVSQIGELQRTRAVDPRQLPYPAAIEGKAGICPTLPTLVCFPLSVLCTAQQEHWASRWGKPNSGKHEPPQVCVCEPERRHHVFATYVKFSHYYSVKNSCTSSPVLQKCKNTTHSAGGQRCAARSLLGTVSVSRLHGDG